MAVSATFLAEVKKEIGVSFNNLDTQIERLIEAAILDLTATADIKTFTSADADALQTGAVICYVKYMWFNDSKYKIAYDDIKEQMAVSGKYRSVMPNEE